MKSDPWGKKEIKHVRVERREMCVNRSSDGLG